MTTTVDELRDQAAGELAKARAIFERADSEGRELTEAETKSVNEHLAAGKELAGRLKRASSDAKMRDAIAQLGLPLGEDYGGKSAQGRPLHPRVKASGGSTWGEQVLDSTRDHFGQYKALVQAGSVPVTVPLSPEPVREAVPVLALRQLIPSVQNTTGRFSYLRQITRENNAAPVAPGERKPTSVYTVERIDDRTRVIAHLSEPISRQDLDDAPMLRTFVDQEMRLGLELALEDQIINGSGTGEEMTGLAHVSGAQQQPWDTDILITTRKAITRLEQFGYLNGAGWVMNPDDWETIELTQDNEARFYYGGPVTAVDPASRRLWSVPVVTSPAAPQGAAFLADFATGTRLQVRQEGMLDWSENIYDPNALGTGQGASDFERNMIRFRFEGRFGLEILRPSAIVEVDLTSGS
ncbi:phage major capsid protein [Streptomyces sp. DSM 44915]|uniref:Phage major capsid protein n=1 Tax=Streptomyces chisholmiae TaxID=3075540 RepID=A0ABU2K0T7_9ACTN|nr:phage major capsid protein [Streptomyces sp. DSM 44915]MDT0270854.1 phage major capsid protein [Streptomyces sp. DSM 44915]